MKKRGEDGHLQAKAGSLGRSQSCWNIDLTLNLQNFEEINFYWGSLPLCATLYGSPSKLMQEVNLVYFWFYKVRTGLPKLLLALFSSFFASWLIISQYSSKLQVYIQERKRWRKMLFFLSKTKRCDLLFFTWTILCQVSENSKKFKPKKHWFKNEKIQG